MIMNAKSFGIGLLIVGTASLCPVHAVRPVAPANHPKDVVASALLSASEERRGGAKKDDSARSKTWRENVYDKLLEEASSKTEDPVDEREKAVANLSAMLEAASSKTQEHVSGGIELMPPERAADVILGAVSLLSESEDHQPEVVPSTAKESLLAEKEQQKASVKLMLKDIMTKLQQAARNDEPFATTNMDTWASKVQQAIEKAKGMEPKVLTDAQNAEDLSSLFADRLDRTMQFARHVYPTNQRAVGKMFQDNYTKELAKVTDELNHQIEQPEGMTGHGKTRLPKEDGSVEAVEASTDGGPGGTPSGEKSKEEAAKSDPGGPEAGPAKNNMGTKSAG